MIKHVYLFDIDGTLINARGVGSGAFRRAVVEVLGIHIDWQGLAFAGQTDAGLFQRALDEAQLANSAEMTDDFFQRYHGYLETHLSESPPERLPGVELLLQQLTSAEGSVLALLTGNTQRGSELKLADLYSVFNFGMFGEQHTDRNDLGRAARRYADEQFGAGVELSIIGDTPNDIACARAAGAHAIAVATGHFSMADLSHADRVFADLTQWSH